MKKWFILSTVACVVFVIGLLAYGPYDYYLSYVYERDFLCFWSLADKASTIPAKKQHIENFYNALNHAEKFASHNAVFLKTDDNSFAKNLAALKTFKDRLTEIETMSPSSFEYNTAIQQITAQEQGEASAMMDVFKGCWYLQNHMFYWGWISTIFYSILIVIVLLAGCAAGIILASSAEDHWRDW